MPLGIALYKIVLFTPHWPPNAPQSSLRNQAIPMMLSEAVTRALASLSAGYRLAIEIDGTTYTELELFHALSRRGDFPG